MEVFGQNISEHYHNVDHLKRLLIYQHPKIFEEGKIEIKCMGILIFIWGQGTI
jgi:hypothetical protein